MEIRIAGAYDVELFARVADDLFDNPIGDIFLSEFLGDPRHHIAVALDGGVVVGFASAVHYVHPDKQPELWINEVAVAPAFQGRGAGKALLRALFDVGRDHGCSEAWVLTDDDNERAVRLYSSVGGAASPHVMFTFDVIGGSRG